MRIQITRVFLAMLAALFSASVFSSIMPDAEQALSFQPADSSPFDIAGEAVTQEPVLLALRRRPPIYPNNPVAYTYLCFIRGGVFRDVRYPTPVANFLLATYPTWFHSRSLCKTSTAHPAGSFLKAGFSSAGTRC